MAIETRAVVAVPQPFGGDITLYSATQIPHILKLMTAVTLGIPEHQVRVVAPSVGGGFGSKLNVYAEELLCVALARKHGVPVRWTETRSENTQATIQGRGQIQHIELAADADGKLTALRVRLLCDMGAYLQLVTPGIPILGAFLYAGVYDLPQAYDFECTVGVHDDDADGRLSRRWAARRRRTPSSGPWTRWRRRSASTRSSCAGATSSPRRPTRTRRGAVSSTTPATTIRRRRRRPG